MLETTAIHFEDEVGQQFTNIPYKSPKTDGTEDVLRSYAARFLPDYMIPSSITVLDKWPLNANGKVDRRSLPVPNRETPAAIEAVSETEIAICKLFAEVLKVDSVSSNDNFFSLGGHSLLAVSLISRIRAKFQRKILVDTLFEAPTPRELAHRLDSLTIANPYGRILALRKVGKLPPFICFPPAGGIGWVYAGLSGSVDQDRPIYCLQASGIMNGEPMLNTIAEIVNDYLVLVKKVQPQGPYYFTGWSFGGIVAHEAACELQRRGEEIAFLSILDTRPVYPRTIEFVQEEHSKIDNASTTIEARLNQYLHLSKQHVGEDWPSNLGPSELHNILELTKQTTKIMANTNHYSIFNGDLLLIAAEYGALFEEGWKPYVTGQIETHQLNCKHLEVTTTGPLKKIGILFEEYMRAASRSFHEVPD
jgi:nonribosomal peptide synthetase DhbF